MEIQNPPQFTLEEVIVIDYSDAGGGNPGSSSPKPIEAATAPSSEKEITQEESPVTAPTNNSKEILNLESSCLKFIKEW